MMPHIRWMIRKDMPQVLGIEAQSFAFPWGEDEFVKCLRERNCIGMVADNGPGDELEVIAYMLYELERDHLNLLNFAVHPDHRYQGVGRHMMQKLITKLSNRRPRIEALIWESNLPAQLFFKACGFRAVERLPEAYEETQEDGYLFRFDVGEQISQFDLDRLFHGASGI